MRVVLGLPPPHAEADLCANRQDGEVVVEAVLEHLVVRKVVREPATLLPEHGDEDRRRDGRCERVRRPGQDSPRRGEDCEPRAVLVGIEELTARRRGGVGGSVDGVKTFASNPRSRA